MPGRDLGDLFCASHIKIIYEAYKSTGTRAPPGRDSGEIGLGWGLHSPGLEKLPGDANVQLGLKTTAVWADCDVICLR